MSNYPISTDVYGIEELYEKYNKMIIPSFQRYYSWGEEEIESLLKNIIDGFNDGEKLFIGTIQIAQVYNKKLDEDEALLIDGQQRLTTLTIILLVLNKLLKPESNLHVTLLNINNNETYKRFYEAMLKDEVINDAKEANKYNQNYNYVMNFFANVDNITLTKDLIEYIYKKVYFVLLETDKDLGLSQIVNIFNTINTTGLDLNCSDLFKLQFADYIANDMQEDMKKINACYDKLITFNNVHGSNWSMDDVLHVYHHIIVSKGKLKEDQLLQSTESFYEMLFNDKELTKDVSEIVTIEAFQYLVELINRVRASFKEDKNIFLKYRNGYCYYSETCMEWTRYGNRFYTIPYVYLFFKFYNKKCIDELNTEDFLEAFSFTFEISKFLTVQSVINDQVVYAVHSYVLNNILYELVSENSLQFILEKVKRDINKPRWSLNTDINDNYGSQEFFRRIKSGLFWNARRSYMVCCWVDFFIEIYNKTNNVVKLLMDWNNNPFDKEHIYPQDIFNDKFKNDNEKLELYNGIGNLTLLERGINREIGADLKKKFEHYKDSKFFTIQEIQKDAEKHGKHEIMWTESDIERRNAFVKKMFMQEFGLTE